MIGQINYNNNYWYRQQIVDKIHELYSNGTNYHLSLSEIILNNDLNLFKSSILRFGSWENAIQKAGINQDIKRNDYEDDTNYWSSEMVLDQIKLLYESKFDLGAHFIKNVYPDLYSISTNKSYFGSWANALFEAEVDYKTLRASSRRFWTRQRILTTLHDYDYAYGNLQPVFIRGFNPSLYLNSHRYFKNWSETLVAAGLNLNKNLIKVKLEPLRTSILMEYTKTIFELLDKKYQVSTEKKDINFPVNESYNNEIEESENQRYPGNYLVLNDDKNQVAITTAYRSWGAEADRKARALLTDYQRVICYYIFGEPRQWVDDNVKFINFEQFYPDLAARGRDDVISDLSLQGRGGIPGEYMEQYTNTVKAINKTIKDKKK